jgi:ribosomal protein S3AE
MNLGGKMTKLSKKQRHQVKSRWYYIFWGAATVSVFAGQMYVGSGYRQMSDSFNRILDTIIIEIEDDFRHKRRHPMLVPPNSAF